MTVSQRGPVSPVPRTARSVADLTAGATSRERLHLRDGKSGSTLERVVIDGDRFILKTVGYSSDWIMRVTGDRDVRTFTTWRAGILHRAPGGIDHTVQAMAVDGTGEDAVLGILMHDVSNALVPEGDAVISLADHRAFLDALADLAATFWGWNDDLGLTRMTRRFRFFAPDVLAPELARPDPARVPQIAHEGWRRLAERAPALRTLAAAVHAEPEPLAAALATTPTTFLHGDWKLGNLGRHPDGRVVLLDWAYPGAGPVCWDLGWYLALNAARLPEAKEDAVEAFADALRRRGVATTSWWQVQLSLSLFAIAVTFAWEKALGDDGELGWWAERAAEGARLLDRLADGWRRPRW